MTDTDGRTEGVPRAQRNILPQCLAEEMADVFRALSDPTRVRIVSALAEGELSVSELAETLGMTLSAVSHQLSLLRDLRVVRARRQGRRVFYCLDDEHVYSLYRRALEHVSHGQARAASAHSINGCRDGNER